MPRVAKPKPPIQQNVPAFQRKRSLSAKARKRPSLATALQRKEAGVPVVKPKRVCRRRVTVAPVLSSSSGFSWGGSTSTPASVGTSESVYERRERLKAKLAAQKNESSGFSSPIVDDYEPSYDSSPVDADVREMQECGVVEAFFDKIDVVAIELTKGIRVGDRLIFETQSGLFEQELESMQIDREDVMTAYCGDDVGIKVLKEPRKGGKVYKLI
jgi:hypothetical protein